MPMGGQARERDRPDPETRDVGDHELEHVRELEDHGRPAGDPEAREVKGEPIDEPTQLRVRDPAGPVDDGQAIGAGGERAAERVAQRDAAPVPALAVTASELLGPGDESVEHGAPAY